MFDALTSSTLSIVADAVYYALRLLKHRYNISDLRKGFVVHGVKSEPSKEAQRIADQLMEEFERTYGGSFKEVDQETVERYTTQLVATLQMRYRKELQYNTERADKFLAQIRPSGW